MVDFDYESLSPGIRAAVKWFHAQGYDTCDSGDGSLLEGGMECGWEEPMVIVQVPVLSSLITLTDEIHGKLGSLGLDVRVEASWSPNERAFVVCYGKGLLVL